MRTKLNFSNGFYVSILPRLIGRFFDFLRKFQHFTTEGAQSAVLESILFDKHNIGAGKQIVGLSGHWTLILPVFGKTLLGLLS